MRKKILCIGGGGAFGAITVGKLHKLNKKYDVILGVSTGAIMSILVGCGEYERAMKAYTTVTNDDVYKVYPFNKKGDLKVYLTALRAFQGYASIGDMTPVLDLIRRSVTPADLDKLKELNVEVVIAVLNVTTGLVEYHSSNDCDYYVFTEYIAAASTPELLGNYWNIDGWEYGDSGLATLVPIVKALDYNPGEIDIFTHRPFRRDIKNGKILDLKAVGITDRFIMIDSAYRCVKIHRENLEHMEIREGVKSAIMEGIEPVVHYIDTRFKHHNPMVMSPKVMKAMYEHGYESYGVSDFKIKFTKDNYKEWFKKQDSLEY